MVDSPPLEPAMRTRLSQAAEDRCPSLPGLIQEHYLSLLGLAQRLMVHESARNSLNPNALVHEAFVRLIDQSRVTARGYNFFRACVAQEFRRILVDHARRRAARVRATGVQIESLSGLGDAGAAVAATELADVLDRLQRLNPRLCQVVEMKVLAGMTIPECADVLGVSPRTVVKDWKFARSWLLHELS